MTIYDIDNAILECVDQESGEVIDIERLNELEIEREKKISNIACWIKNLDADANAIKEEKKNLASRQSVCEKKAQSLRDYLSTVLNGTKYSDAKCAISFRKSESVEIDEDHEKEIIENLPKEYIKVTKSIKKDELKTALKMGFEFEGCALKQNKNIQIK